MINGHPIASFFSFCEHYGNALKRAFSLWESGEISITGRLDGNRIELIIRDSGKGIPDGFDWRNADSLGLRLVNILTDQMNGTIELVTGHGTTFRLSLEQKA